LRSRTDEPAKLLGALIVLMTYQNDGYALISF
jgi:hypothetical protein